MIYLDSAATSYHKPDGVARAVAEAISHMGNPGRGAHEASLDASRVVYGTREKMAELFGAEEASQIVFTANSTESLNIAIMHNLDEHMEAEKLIEIINRFLGGLSDRDRDIFVQRYWVMESIKNIATRHKMSEGAIKQSLLRNKRKLKKILEKEGRL